MPTFSKYKVTRVGDSWYRVTGHPVIHAFIRKHSAGRWGYGYRVTQTREGALGQQAGDEFFCYSYAEAVAITKSRLARDEEQRETLSP